MLHDCRFLGRAVNRNNKHQYRHPGFQLIEHTKFICALGSLDLFFTQLSLWLIPFYSLDLNLNATFSKKKESFSTSSHCPSHKYHNQVKNHSMIMLTQNSQEPTHFHVLPFSHIHASLLLSAEFPQGMAVGPLLDCILHVVDLDTRGKLSELVDHQ